MPAKRAPAGVHRRDRAEVVALACALPAESGVPLSKWTCPELARELAARCRMAVSASTIRRWLAGDALKPWQHRSWISVRDPGFAGKAAARVLDLCAGTWNGRRLAAAVRLPDFGAGADAVLPGAMVHRPGRMASSHRRLRD